MKLGDDITLEDATDAVEVSNFTNVGGSNRPLAFLVIVFKAMQLYCHVPIDGK